MCRAICGDRWRPASGLAPSWLWAIAQSAPQHHGRERPVSTDSSCALAHLVIPTCFILAVSGIVRAFGAPHVKADLESPQPRYSISSSSHAGRERLRTDDALPKSKNLQWLCRTPTHSRSPFCATVPRQCNVEVPNLAFDPLNQLKCGNSATGVATVAFTLRKD